MKRTKRLRGAVVSMGVLAAVAIALLFALDPFGTRVVHAEEPIEEAATNSELDLPAWMDFELVDAVSGEVFTIREMIGKPILLESFAVWCSTCLRQQKEVAKLAESEGDRILHISLDTDPNEDLDRVKDHALRNGFGWYFAVAPIEMTQMLIDTFGLTVVNAPRAPVVLIAEDGSSRLLENGVKFAAELLEATGLEPSSSEEGES